MRERDKYRQTELGIERFCIRCEDYWPADSEFWHKRGNGFHSYCRSCVLERSKELKNSAIRKIKLYKRGLLKQ